MNPGHPPVTVGRSDQVPLRDASDDGRSSAAGSSCGLLLVAGGFGMCAYAAVDGPVSTPA